MLMLGPASQSETPAGSGHRVPPFLPDCPAANCRSPGFPIAWFPGFPVARLPGSSVARVPGCPVARLPDKTDFSISCHLRNLPILASPPSSSATVALKCFHWRTSLLTSHHIYKVEITSMCT